MSLWGYVKGTFFNLTLFFTTLFGVVFVMMPALPLLFVSASAFRGWQDFWGHIWLTLPGALFELLFGTEVVVTGDVVDAHERALIIANHRCRLDWMYFWMIQQRVGRLRNSKIILRRDLKWLPGPGWAMQYLLFMFLSRRWDVDKGYLERALKYFTSQNYPLQLMIFPEGTNMCGQRKRISNEFAEKNNLPAYEHVLHPRVTGFSFFVEQLSATHLDAVYDVTLAYTGNLCYGEKDLAAGRFPEKIHAHITRYPIASLPTETEPLNEWCRARWHEKEARLAAFHAAPPHTASFGTESPLMREAARRTHRLQAASLVFWTVFLAASFYVFAAVVWLRWYVVVAWAVNVAMYAVDGVDGVQIMMGDKLKAS